jgi:hypothetical protein
LTPSFTWSATLTFTTSTSFCIPTCSHILQRKTGC